jgi:predicted TIM-barrel fold metal-dependent hydrolase
MSTRSPYPVFDADNHMYETRDAFTKFLPKEFDGAIRYVEVDGRTKIAVRGQISEYIPNPTFDVVARPGAQEDYFRHGNPEGKSYRELVGKPMRSIDAFREPAARLKLMDEQGLDRTLMFPTLASLLEERMRDDPELTHAVVHALNEWMYETWQFNYENRIYATPVITLPIVEKAIEELEWVVARGARAILIRPAPVPGFQGSRSFGLPEFDPFWAKVVEYGLLVGMHSSDSGYTRYQTDWDSNKREYLPFKPDVFKMTSMWRPIEDSVAALVCHGALSRFPELKISVIENGAAWVAPLMKSLKDAYKKYPQGFDEHPHEVMRRNINISPFWEEDYKELGELLGIERILFGSDYPHPEGLADPVSHLATLTNLTEDEKFKVMGGNLAKLIDG